uniref:Cadherin-89D n=1 Tax=Cacopsylla melanoneura TaxID=428564 RepID=A0A8D8ZBD2_9HEMI
MNIFVFRDSFVAVEVTLLDANDNNPVFFPSNIYDFTITSDKPIGTIVGKIEARDPDLGRNGMVLYELQKNNRTRTPHFTVDPQSGQIMIASAPVPLGKHSLFIEASDQPVNPSERRFSLAVVTIEVQTPAVQATSEYSRHILFW